MTTGNNIFELIRILFLFQLFVYAFYIICGFYIITDFNSQFLQLTKLIIISYFYATRNFSITQLQPILINIPRLIVKHKAIKVKNLAKEENAKLVFQSAGTRRNCQKQAHRVYYNQGYQVHTSKSTLLQEYKTFTNRNPIFDLDMKIRITKYKYV